MRGLAVSLATVGTVLSWGTSLAADGTTLSVRVLNLVAVADEDISRAYAVARSVYAEAGIDLTWVRCSAPEKVCANALGTTDVWLRVAPGFAQRRPGLPPRALGFATIDPTLKTGKIATVYVGQIARLARQAETPFDTLLGLVVAHELGHLLLGSLTHERTGLMRSEWSVADIRSEDFAPARFSDTEAAHLRAGLARRARKAPAF